MAARPGAGLRDLCDWKDFRMPLVSLFALALLAADPQTAPLGPSKPAPALEEPFPVGAPTDDYDFVSWCYGALSGHMDLYTIVKPELDKLPDPRPQETKVLDAEQKQAGQEYLILYRRATDAAEGRAACPAPA